MIRPQEDPNLLNRVKVEPMRQSSASYKAIVFEALTALIALVSGYLTHDYLVHGGTPYYLIGAFTFYLSFSVLLSLWTRSFSRRSFVLALEALAIVIFFYSLTVLPLLGLLTAVYFFGFWGIFRLKRLYENSIDLRFMATVRPQILKMLTGLIITFVIVYPNYRPDALVPSKDFIETAYRGGTGFISMFFPGLEADGTVDDFVRTMVEISLANDTQFFSLSQGQKDAAIVSSIQATEQHFSNVFGFPVTGTMPASSFFSSIIRAKLGQYEASFGTSFLIVWMVIVFIIIRSFAAVYYLIVAILAYLLYEILTAFEVIHTASESRAHEYIEFTKNF